MQKLILLAAFFSITICNSQVFIGTNDNKLQLATNIQDNASGINISYDYGLGENISVGVTSSYALSINDNISASFGDRFDAKVRFNAHLGSVVKIDDNFDIYPGLNLSLKNFGGHLGMRYFFSDGFGIFTEFNVPLAKYNPDVLDAGEKLHNQFTLNLGAAFNL
ncbi:DUF6646 family protein [Mariniflexile sp.]|uniref:DUF6646 family protein n=1 Tax=Mariniflexile sp. TaxID=1979402 RepID=UPI00356918AE